MKPIKMKKKTVDVVEAITWVSACLGAAVISQRICSAVIGDKNGIVMNAILRMGSVGLSLAAAEAASKEMGKLVIEAVDCCVEVEVDDNPEEKIEE